MKSLKSNFMQKIFQQIILTTNWKYKGVYIARYSNICSWLYTVESNVFIEMIKKSVSIILITLFYLSDLCLSKPSIISKYLWSHRHLSACLPLICDPGGENTLHFLIKTVVWFLLLIVLTLATPSSIFALHSHHIVLIGWMGWVVTHAAEPPVGFYASGPGVFWSDNILKIPEIPETRMWNQFCWWWCENLPEVSISMALTHWNGSSLASQEHWLH